jgi:hypothetical protein
MSAEMREETCVQQPPGAGGPWPFSAESTVLKQIDSQVTPCGIIPVTCIITKVPLG